MDKQFDERTFDGRIKHAPDVAIEALLEAHFERFGITRQEICRNFQIYARRVFLKRFLAHYELFRLTIDLPGDIVELGVYRGASLFSWANFLEIRNMGDRAKRVIGFDNFAGFKTLDAKDGAPDPKVGKVTGGFDGGTFDEQLHDAIAIYDQDRFIGYKPRVIIVKGDIEVVLPLLRLSRRRKQRLRKPLRLYEATGQRLAADFARALIVRPSGA